MLQRWTEANNAFLLFRGFKQAAVRKVLNPYSPEKVRGDIRTDLFILHQLAGRRERAEVRITGTRGSPEFLRKSRGPSSCQRPICGVFSDTLTLDRVAEFPQYICLRIRHSPIDHPVVCPAHNIITFPREYRLT